MFGSCWNHRALNLRALATEHGDGVAVLVGHAHIVNTVSAGQGLLNAYAGQHIAHMRRF